MFALIISGRPVDTNIQQVDPTRYCFNITESKGITKLAVFTTDPIPLGYIAKVYIQKDLNQWQYVGSLSPSKPSIISSSSPSSSCLTNLDQTQIGISIEQGIVSDIEIEESKQENSVAMTLLNDRISEIGEVSRLIGENLFNYVSSFARSILGEEVVPLKSIQEWYQGFLRKDPSRWLINNSNNSSIIIKK